MAGLTSLGLFSVKYSVITVHYAAPCSLRNVIVTPVTVSIVRSVARTQIPLLISLLTNYACVCYFDATPKNVNTRREEVGSLW